MDKTVYRMSSAGKCIRALSAKRLGYEAASAPVWLEQAAEEGKWHETRIKQQLFEQGWFVHSEQEEVILNFPNFMLIGHIDGMITEDGEWSAYSSNKPVPPSQLLEIKSMSQFEFDRWMKGRFEAFPNYADQITCYMEATGLRDVLYIVKNRSSGYEDIIDSAQPLGSIAAQAFNGLIKEKHLTWKEVFEILEIKSASEITNFKIAYDKIKEVKGIK